jgi:hypothetical protein
MHEALAPRAWRGLGGWSVTDVPEREAERVGSMLSEQPGDGPPDARQCGPWAGDVRARLGPTQAAHGAVAAGGWPETPRRRDANHGPGVPSACLAVWLASYREDSTTADDEGWEGTRSLRSSFSTREAAGVKARSRAVERSGSVGILGRGDGLAALREPSHLDLLLGERLWT